MYGTVCLYRKITSKRTVRIANLDWYKWKLDVVFLITTIYWCTLQGNRYVSLSNISLTCLTGPNEHQKDDVHPRIQAHDCIMLEFDHGYQLPPI